jgi:hypothetical protein
MSLLERAGKLTVEIGHADVQQRVGLLGRSAHLAVLLEAIADDHSTANSAALVEIGRPGRCRCA